MTFRELHQSFGAPRFQGAVRFLILSTLAVLILQKFFDGTLFHYLGLVPVLVTERNYWWQLATYLFLHGGVVHWLLNAIGLWMFGNILESQWGTKEFLKFFFITGIGAGLCVLILSPHSTVPIVGFSGAVFGMLVAFPMLFPDAVIYLYFVIPVKAWHAALLFAVIEFFGGIYGGAAGISRFAHLGGMLTGYLYLRFGWQISQTLRAPWRPVQAWLQRRKFTPGAPKKQVELHEVTDDMVDEVDRILEKVLRDGAESLTSHEKNVMDRYSRRKK
jgi:membrane associated rhomboid family serine protease